MMLSAARACVRASARSSNAALRTAPARRGTQQRGMCDVPRKGGAQGAVPRKGGGSGRKGGGGGGGGGDTSARGYVFGGGVVAAGMMSWVAISDDSYATAARESLDSVAVLHDAAAWTRVQWREMTSSFTRPVRDELLPNWPPVQLPPDTPQPMTLVVNLEGTLVKSTWDRRYGWRHAKRPGADRFLERMAKNFELVIFSANIFGVADPVVTLLDPKGCVYHRLYRDACWYKEGKYIKDLSKLNRDEKRIIIVDNKPEAYSMQPDNAIPIAEFTDPGDKGDQALEELLPLLEALALADARQQRRTDVRTTLAQYKETAKHTGRSYAELYQEMVLRHEMSQRAKQTKGLGGFARNFKTAQPGRHVNQNLKAAANAK
eukprot:g3876.t1